MPSKRVAPQTISHRPSDDDLHEDDTSLPGPPLAILIGLMPIMLFLALLWGIVALAEHIGAQVFGIMALALIALIIRKLIT